MNDKETIYDFIKEIGYPGMKDVDISSMSTDECRMLRAFLGDSPESHLYGKIIGFFEYTDGRVFEFMFHVHGPNQKSPHLSNRMTNIDELTVDHTQYGDFVNKKGTSFGNMAFWLHTDMAYLQEKDTCSAHLRSLMLNVRNYSRGQELCQKLRKTDGAHLKWSADH